MREPPKKVVVRLPRDGMLGSFLSASPLTKWFSVFAVSFVAQAIERSLINFGGEKHCNVTSNGGGPREIAFVYRL